AEALDRPQQPAGEQQRPDNGRQRRRRRDGEDLHVVVHVEHHPAGGEYGYERQAHGEQRERGGLQAQRRQRADGVRGGDAGGQGGGREGDRGDWQGENR